MLTVVDASQSNESVQFLPLKRPEVTFDSVKMDTPNELKGNCQRKSNEIYDEEDIVPETPDSKVKLSDSSDGIHDTDANITEITDVALNTTSTKWEEPPNVLESEAQIEKVNSLTESEQLFDDDIQGMNSKSNSLEHHGQGSFEEHQLERFSFDESERINIDEVISCLKSQRSQPKPITATAAELITLHNQLALRIDSLFSDMANSTQTLNDAVQVLNDIFNNST